MIPIDDLNRLGVLNRREIEARILAPFIEALSEKLPRAEVIETLRQTIMQGASHCDFRYRERSIDE
jgi:hypothetical protein